MRDPLVHPHEPLHPETRIGHVHLKVADLERAIVFYHDALGFELMGRLGDKAAFLSAGGYHHHIGLNTFESQGGNPPPPGSTGLFHVAILYPNRRELGRALRRLLDHGGVIDAAADHGGSEAVYLRDPDGNGIELTWDRDRVLWPRDEHGALALRNEPLDPQDILAEVEPMTASTR
jgi:catechol 2,3-dioxygenase